MDMCIKYNNKLSWCWQPVFDGSKQYNEKSQNRIIPRISGEAPQNGLKWKLALTYISRT